MGGLRCVWPGIGLAEDLSGEEDHGVERLFLGGCRPVDFEDVAGEPCHGADGLLKLPGREVGATAEALEENLRG